MALQILGDHTPAALNPMLADLASHPSKKVRQAALERIEVAPPRGHRGHPQGASRDASRTICCEALALRALSAVEGPLPKDELMRHASSSILALREAALLGLLRMGAPEGTAGIHELARSPDSARQIRGRAPAPPRGHPLRGGGGQGPDRG